VCDHTRTELYKSSESRATAKIFLPAIRGGGVLIVLQQ
jgi:hypothetical protein